MNSLLLFFGKIINNVFGYSKQKYKYYAAWKYLHQISLMGMGRIQGNPIEADGEIDVIKKIMKSAPGPEIVIFDVGANKGQYSSHVLSEVLPEKKIQLHIFEPSASNTGTLKDQFNSSRYPQHQFIVNQLALSDTNSHEYLYTDTEGSDLGSLLNLKTSVRPFNDANKETVETMTLDQYVEKNGVAVIDFIKIDVEGGEYKVLSGAVSTIQQNRIKHIQFEFGAGNITARVFFLDFWEMLSSKYNFYQVLSGGLVPVNSYNSDLEIFKTTNYLLIIK